LLADRLQVHRGVFAPAINLEFELEPVALVKRRNARTLDSRNVDEGVGLAVVALDETKALHRIEELDRAAGLFAGKLALWTTATSTSGAATAALDRHRLAFDSKVGRRNPAAAIYEGELERLAVGKIGETRLLDRRDVDEHILTAIIAHDKAEALLRVEEFDDALAFADDLRGHSAATAAPKAAATAATETTAAAVTATAAAEAAAITIAATAAPAAKAAAILVTAEFSAESAFFAETFALVATAPAAVPLAPSIETHEPSELE
jgi:hypothetical protein